MAAIVPERGTVTLVDTGNDGDYDLIRVTAYEVAIVNRVSDSLKMINFLNDKTMDASYITLTTDEYPNLKEYNITLDGKAIDVKDLQQYDVLTIATNSWEDPTYFDIIVTRNVVEGAVSERNLAEEFVVINGEKYEITKGFRSLKLPAIDDEGLFYLDAEGKIAYYDVSSVSNGNYAYLYRTGTGNFKDEYYLRMFTKDGEDANFRVLDKIKINKVYKSTLNTQYTWADIASIFDKTAVEVADNQGISYETVYVKDENGDNTKVIDEKATEANAQAAIAVVGVKANDLFNGASTTELTPIVFIETLVEGEHGLNSNYALTGNPAADKFVTYTASSDGKVTELMLANPTGIEDDFGYTGTTNGKVEWQASLNKFRNSSDLAENAVIFFVSNEDNATIDDFQVKTVADLKDGNEYQPYFFTYTDEGVAAALVLDIESALGSNLAVFEEYTEATDPNNGDEVYFIKCWLDGKLVETSLMAEKSLLEGDVLSMSKGDAFVYATNDKGRIESISTIFSPGSSVIPFGTDLNGTYIDISNSEVAKDFEILGQGGEYEKDNQVYFGYVGKITENKNGLRVTLVDESGVFGGTSQQSVIIPDSANVLYYNPAMGKAKQIQSATKETLNVGNFQTLANGNIDFINSKPENMNYAFVRIYNDVVTDVIYVRYQR